MTKEELEKDYYADRPIEPYTDDDSPTDWANIARYAEENLEKAFKRIVELEKENAERPKWHKVADGDLPLVNTTVLNENSDKVIYYGEGKWQEYSDYYEDYIDIEPPIAWCEKPIYTEE